MHKLIFDDEALKQLEKLDFPIKETIFKKIRSTKENPKHYFLRLKGKKEYKLRIGDYRAIADINEKEIIILRVGHRKNIYKNS
jgi:mRNA interferase RelE/StbE